MSRNCVAACGPTWLAEVQVRLRKAIANRTAGIIGCVFFIRLPCELGCTSSQKLSSNLPVLCIQPISKTLWASRILIAPGSKVKVSFLTQA